jgi:hypothetical protein
MEPVYRSTNTASSSQRSAYQPVTTGNVHLQAESALFEGLESTSSRTFGGLLFAAVFILSQNLLQFSGLLYLLLLVCLLYRMDSRERRIAGVPLAFAATRLALSLTAVLAGGWVSTARAGGNSPAFVGGLHWMPLLFAAYLFYSPWKSSCTSRVIFWYAMTLLLSGLVPGDGCLYISALLFYTLFIALAIALVMDFSPGKFAAQTRPQQPPRGATAQAEAAFS